MTHPNVHHPNVRHSYDLNPGAPKLDFLMEATGGTGRHLRVCLPIADTTESLVPARVRDRRRATHCTRCGIDVWYDPSGSLYPPGEDIVCTRRCLHLALMAATAANTVYALMTQGTAFAFVMADAHVNHDPRKSAMVQAAIRRAGVGD